MTSTQRKLIKYFVLQTRYFNSNLVPNRVRNYYIRGHRSYFKNYVYISNNSLFLLIKLCNSIPVSVDSVPCLQGIQIFVVMKLAQLASFGFLHRPSSVVACIF